jgi:hypothetical protein
MYIQKVIKQKTKKNLYLDPDIMCMDPKIRTWIRTKNVTGSGTLVRTEQNLLSLSNGIISSQYRMLSA